MCLFFPLSGFELACMANLVARQLPTIALRCHDPYPKEITVKIFLNLSGDFG